MRTISMFIALVLSMAGIANATTYYVRTDGGDASQCTGKSDAAYPGSGTAQACAYKHPFFALAPGSSKRMIGGDALIIGSGTYTIGAGAPGAGSCSGAGCYLGPIPSGSSSLKTRVVGKSASAPPKFLGTNGVTVIHLDGSSNVEVGNIEITDQSDCVYTHTDASATCPGSGPWAKGGLSASASSNVWLHDLNIHGMGATGVLAGGLTNWTVERVKLIANGRAGWNGNIGTSGESSNSGNIIFRNLEIGWSGCGERWQTGVPWACWAQQTGGYGDGLGTTYTGGQWLFEDSYFHHNTSDGLDLRYMDGADTTNVTIRRLRSHSNAGNQLKVRGNSIIENSVLVSDCGYFEGKYFMLLDDNCRANGNTLQLVFTSNDTAIVRHNTIAGEGGVLIGNIEGDSTGSVKIQNNVLVGFPVFTSPTVLASVFYANAAPAPVSYSGNLVWNVKSNFCPPGSICGHNPELTNMTLNAFDAKPLSGSPVIDSAPLISAVTSDFLSNPRPSGAASDIGAYEFQAGAPPPPPSYVYSWSVSAYGACSATTCGTSGTQTRSVVCKRDDGVAVTDSYCSALTKPSTSQPCSAVACAPPPPSYVYSWSVSAYGACSATACGTSGTQTRSVVCKRDDGVAVADSYCSALTKPVTSQPCSAVACAPPPPSSTFAITVAPEASDITSSDAMISWSLSDYGTGQVQYGTTTSYGSFSTPETSFKFKAHTQPLSGLSAGRVYHYRVISKNAAGAQVISADKTFTTSSIRLKYRGRNH